METEVLKTQASARKMKFEQKCKEARHRIIMLEKSKAMKRVKELKEIHEKLKSAKSEAASAASGGTSSTANMSSLRQPSSANTSRNPFDDGEDEGAGGGDRNPFIDDDNANTVGQNPFDEDNTDGDDSMNPFLQEDRGLLGVILVFKAQGGIRFDFNEF